MPDIQTQQAVKITDNINTVGITGGSALLVDGSAVTQPVGGTITVGNSPTVTLAANSTVTLGGTPTVTLGGNPTVTLAAASITGTRTVVGVGTAGTASGGVLTVQGVASMTPLLVNGSAVTQPVSGTVSVTGSTVTLGGTPTVTLGGNPTVTFAAGQTVTLGGTNNVTLAGTPTVTLAAASITATRTVIGAGTAGTANTGVMTVQGIAGMTPLLVNGSAVTQPVSGTVAVSGGTVTLAGGSTVTSVQSGTYTVVQGTAASLNAAVVGTGTAGTPAGGVLSVQGVAGGMPIPFTPSAVTTGIINVAATITTVAAASTGTVSYTVTSGKTMFLKGIFASSSGAPAKVTVDTGTGPYTTVVTGFYAPAMPFLGIEFPQPPVYAAGTVINVKIQNNAGSTQDLYCTINGLEA